MTEERQAVVERFRPTSGRVTGALTLVLAATVVIIGLVELTEGFPTWVMTLAVLVGLLAWASMLRPALWVTRDHLVMRNMLETVHVPLAAIESLVVRQVTAVRVGDRRLVSTVVGRSWRKAAKAGKRAPTPVKEGPPTDVAYADFAEERLHQLIDDARAAAGVRPGSAEQLALADAVRREPAWLPIVLIGLAAVALVATLVA